MISLRADASPSIGFGHVMRSLTLGAALVARDAEVVLVTPGLPDPLAARAARLGVRVVTAAPSDAFLVLDGYQLAAPAGPYAAIDDNREAPVVGASLVLNQNLHATAAMYADLSTRLLLGPRFALLREGLARRTDPIADGTRVVVAMGGTDPRSLTAPIVETLRGFDVRTPDSFDDFVELLIWADIAVIAAGTTMWEVGYVGLPAVAVVVADNQRAAAKAADAAGFIVNVEPVDVTRTVDALARDKERRIAMRAAGQALFDGKGAARVADAVIEVAQQ